MADVHAEPLRLRIQKALTAALEEITIANGYKHDLEGKVFRGRTMFGEGDPSPLVSVLQVPIPIDQFPTPRGSSVTRGPWDLIIQGFVEDDLANPTDPAEMLMADVKKRLVLERQKTLPRDDSDPLPPFGIEEIDDVWVGVGVVRPPDEVSATAYFWLALTLNLVEDIADPYN